jgi:hypothetical protein
MEVIRWLQEANFICIGSSELFRNHKASLKTAGFCDVTLYGLIEATGVSEKHFLYFQDRRVPFKQAES